MEIKTNNQPRNLMYFYELTEKEMQEFDYLTDEEIVERDFVRYKGIVYDLGEFIVSPPEEWDGFHPESFFSGILVKYVNSDQVIMGEMLT